MNPTFEPTSTFAYAFARDVAMPAIKARPDVASGAAFRLRDAVKLVIADHLTEAQQAAVIPTAKSPNIKTVRLAVMFYAERIAKEGKECVWMGAGMYRLPTVDDVTEDEIDEIDDAAIDDAVANGGDDESAVAAAEFDGTLYAFSYPMLLKDGTHFPIKFGKTSGDVQKRVDAQCKNSAVFEKPVILGSWPVKRVGTFETVVHGVLKVRGRWREGAPGTEWFDTTLAEIEGIVKMVAGV
jgi:hypothetical protein